MIRAIWAVSLSQMPYGGRHLYVDVRFRLRHIDRETSLNPKIQRNFEVFTPCDFIAAITEHIPDKSFQIVRYYGWYSNKMRGQRDKHAAEEAKAAGNPVEVIEISEHNLRRRRAGTDGSARGSMRLCGRACNRCVGAPGFSNGKECSAGTGHGTAMGPVPDRRAAVLGWSSEQVTVRPRCSFSWPVPAVESTIGSLATSATRGVLRDGLFV